MENLDLVKVGKEMKRLRNEHAYTQEQVAEELGCTVAFISNVENNRAKLNLRILMYYAKLCNVTVDSILNAGRSENDARSASETRDAELLFAFHSFSAKEQDKIIKVLKYLKDGKTL